MAYCTRCGTKMAESDRFCQTCGLRNPDGKAGFTGAGGYPAAGAQAMDAIGGSISPRLASILCYVPFVGFIMCLLVLASDSLKRIREVKFHAFQGLYLFVAWLVTDVVLSPIFHQIPGPTGAPVGLLKLVILIAWVFMLIKTSNGETVRLPLVGEWAERSMDGV